MTDPATGYAALTAMEFKELATCVDSIGTADFPGRICDFSAGLCNADTVFLTALFDQQKPIALYANHAEQRLREALELYLDLAYVLDPFFHLFRQKRGDAVVRLDEIAPDDFKRSEYYRMFYRAMRLSDECGLMLHMSGAAALFFSFGAQGSRQTDPGRLRIAMPLIAALVRRHWTVLTPEQPDGSGRLAAHLMAAFEAFGDSVLSPREGEIVRLILKGNSTKAIAQMFGNSPETIKVHRKRIFAKLDVASQGELLSLFLDALARMPATAEGDPLRYLPARG